MNSSYNIKWYWWLLLFLTFPIGWIIAMFILDDMYDPSHKEWEEEMDKILKDYENSKNSSKQ